MMDYSFIFVHQICIKCSLVILDILTQCNLEAQHSPTVLYPNSPIKLPVTHQRCIRDKRLEGNVGRCGLPDAPRTVDSRGFEICLRGGQCERYINPNWILVHGLTSHYDCLSCDAILGSKAMHRRCVSWVSTIMDASFYVGIHIANMT
jgi:hypothetical protein